MYSVTSVYCRLGSSSRTLLVHAKRFGQYTGQAAGSGSSGPSSSDDSNPSQRPTSPAIDDSIIAKYSGRAVVPDRPASGSARPSSSRPSSRASQRPTSSTPSQRPSSAKPPIDESVIAKYSGRAVVPDRPTSASSRPSSSSTRRPTSSQRPGTPTLPADLPASGSTGVSSSKPTFDDKKVEVNVYNPYGETSTQGTACHILFAYPFACVTVESGVTSCCAASAHVSYCMACCMLW